MRKTLVVNPQIEFVAMLHYLQRMLSNIEVKVKRALIPTPKIKGKLVANPTYELFS